MRISESDILGARILVVDDREPGGVPLERTLREAGYGNIASTRARPPPELP